MVIARAMVFVMAMVAVAPAQPTPPRMPQPVEPVVARVPLVLLGAPATFEVAKFAAALDTYVTTAQIVVAVRADATDEALCAEALASDSRAGLWARFAGETMTISFVRDACTVETSTVEMPADQPAFVYRVAALKIASLVRDVQLPAPKVVAPPVVEKAVVVEEPAGRTIEVGASGVASLDAEGRIYDARIGAWFGRRVMVGGALSASAARDVDAAGGSGSARAFGALAGVRATLVDGTVALDADIGAGIVAVFASADRITGAEAMSESVWTPMLSIAPRARIGIVGPMRVRVAPGQTALRRSVDVSLGPTVELATRSVALGLGESPLYRANWLRLRWDVRIQIWF